MTVYHKGSRFDLDVRQILKVCTGNKPILLEHRSVKTFQSSDLTHVPFTALARLVGADTTGRAQREVVASNEAE